MNDFVKNKIKTEKSILLEDIYQKWLYINAMITYNLKEATVLVSQVIAKRKENYDNSIASFKVS